MPQRHTSLATTHLEYLKAVFATISNLLYGMRSIATKATFILLCSISIWPVSVSCLVVASASFCLLFNRSLRAKNPLLCSGFYFQRAFCLQRLDV